MPATQRKSALAGSRIEVGKLVDELEAQRAETSNRDESIVSLNGEIETLRGQGDTLRSEAVTLQQTITDLTADIASKGNRNRFIEHGSCRT